MCTICMSMRPAETEYDYHNVTSFGDIGAALPIVDAAAADGTTDGNDGAAIPTFSNDQIADQLTEGYWASTGRGERSFDLGEDRTLVVDISDLTEAGQNLATEALQAWSGVTGITFEFYEEPTGGTTVTESGDAAANTGTNASVEINDTFEGTLSGAGDSDWVAVQLEAGETYTISLAGDGSAAELSDPLLRLYNASGTQVAFNDDGGAGYDSLLTFTATSSGTYYVGAGSYNNSGSGNYELQVTGGASQAPHITFDDNESGAFASSSTSGGTILSSHVNVSTAWLASSGTSLTSYSYQTYIHEIGHAIGLGHGGNYNGGADYNTDASYTNDSWQSSVMSYFSQNENSSINASYARVSTPQVADIIAVQNLYGVSETARSGNSVYGDNATSDHNIDLLTTNSNTIFDDGGIDTIDLSSRSNNQRIDLEAESFSDINGRVGNLGIARDTVIENAITGNGSDSITGNEAKNLLSGGGGTDTLVGKNGADRLKGGDGNDAINAGNGDDTVWGGDGNDFIQGGSGNDELRGNGGNDEISAGRGNDRLYGHDGDDTLIGKSGHDRLYGGTGDDSLNGGNGDDQFHFMANNGTDVVEDFGNGGDRLYFDDSMVGSASNASQLIDAYASVTGDGVLFDFGGGNSVLLEGVNSLNGLEDDILII